MTKLVNSQSGKLTAGKHLCQIARVITKDKEQNILEKRGQTYIGVVLEGVEGASEGKSHWENCFLSGRFVGKTIQLLKAAGLIKMADVVTELDFEPSDLIGKVVGVEIKRNGDWLNVNSFMTEEQFRKAAFDEDIPF